MLFWIIVTYQFLSQKNPYVSNIHFTHSVNV